MELIIVVIEVKTGKVMWLRHYGMRRIGGIAPLILNHGTLQPRFTRERIPVPIEKGSLSGPQGWYGRHGG